MDLGPNTAMSKPIRILLVEDRELDAERILQEIKPAGFDPHCKRVACASEYMENLTGDLEVILSDYALPGFDGMIALELLRNSGLNVPFILVSGPIGEEVAAAAIPKGATVFCEKDRLGRLPVTVTSALEQKRLREQHRVLEEQLRQSQKMEVFGGLAGGMRT